MKYLFLSFLLLPLTMFAQPAGRIVPTQTPLNIKNPPNSLVWADTNDLYRFYASSFNSFLISAFTNDVPYLTSASISGKLNISDTAMMLAPYLRKADTGSMLTSYLRKTDTSSLSTRIDARVKYSDTSGMLTPYLRKIDTSSLSNRIDIRVRYSDTLAMLNPYLRKADTASLSSRIDQRVKYTDTATILSPYLRKADTVSLSTRINLRVRYTDTAAMLTPYLRTSDGAVLARNALSLTTTGSSGAATYNSSTGILNVPQYANSGGTVTSVGMASSDFAISGSPVTANGNITANLNTSGVAAGTYNGSYTVTNKGILTSANSKSQSITSRTLGTAFQVSTTKAADVNYSVLITLSSVLTGTASGSVQLQISSDNVTFNTASTSGYSISGLVSTATNTQTLSAFVPAGYYVKIVFTGNTTGIGSSAAGTYQTGQEIIY